MACCWHSCLNIDQTARQTYCSLVRVLWVIYNAQYWLQIAALRQQGDDGGMESDWSSYCTAIAMSSPGVAATLLGVRHRKKVAAVPETLSLTQPHRNRAPRVEFKKKKNSPKPQKECFHFDHLLFPTPATIKTNSLISLMFFIGAKSVLVCLFEHHVTLGWFYLCRGKQVWCQVLIEKGKQVFDWIVVVHWVPELFFMIFFFLL